MRLLGFLTVASGLLLAGCFPSNPTAEHGGPSAEARVGRSTTEADAPATTQVAIAAESAQAAGGVTIIAKRPAPTASAKAEAAPTFSVMGRMPAQPGEAAVPGTFSPVLAYAAPEGEASFAPGNDPFAFALRGVSPAKTAPEPTQADAALSPPLPRAAPQRKERARTRLASLGAIAVPPSDEDTHHIGPRTGKAGEIAAMVTAMAKKHGVPVPLAHAVVRVESNYKPGLVGRGATYGLMQIKYPTARGMGFAGKPKDLFDPATNLEWGMRYLAGARRIAKGSICGTVLRYQGGHYASRMTRAASVYCGKVRRFMAEAAPRRQKVLEASAAH